MTDATETPEPAPTPRTFSEQLDGVFGNARAKLKFFEILSKSVVELVGKSLAPLARRVEAQQNEITKVSRSLDQLATINAALVNRIRLLEIEAVESKASHVEP